MEEIQENHGEAEELCLCCLDPIFPAANFCRGCGAPTGFLATLLPFQQVFAEGFVYHRAIQRPRSVISVLGIWLLFSEYIVFGALFLHAFVKREEFYELMGGYEPSFLDRLIQSEHIIGGTMVIFGVAGIWQSTRNYLGRERVVFESDETE